MKAVTIDEGRVAARIKAVDEHLRVENAHDLDATMATLNETPQFKLNNDEFGGQDSVRAFYASLFTGFPNLHSHDRVHCFAQNHLSGSLSDPRG